MGQHNRFVAILHEFGLTPGDLRALSVLDQEPPAACRRRLRLFTRLHEPPADFLALDRATR